MCKRIDLYSECRSCRVFLRKAVTVKAECCQRRWDGVEGKLVWKMCSVYMFNITTVSFSALDGKTRVKRVQACKAFLTFLPVFPPSREAFVCAKSAAGSPTCDDTSADVQKYLLCCSSALMLMDFVHILDKQDALNHQKSHWRHL